MLQAYKGKVIVHNMERGEQQSASGIVLGNDEGKSEGIRARWAQVYAVGEGVDDFEVGQWILVSHGRWTRGINYEGSHIYMVDYPSGVLAASEGTEMPEYKAMSQHSSKQEFSYRPEMFEDYTGNKLMS